MRNRIEYSVYEVVSKIPKKRRAMPVDIASYYENLKFPPFGVGKQILDYNPQGEVILKQQLIQLREYRATLLITSNYDAKNEIKKGLIEIIADETVKKDLVEQIGARLFPGIKLREISK